MAGDKYSAVWISYSSISDFLKCPRAYYLNNVYKDPVTRRKINLVTASMSLGHAVHNTLEPLARVPVDKRLSQPIHDRFEQEWKALSGIRGGFKNTTQEQELHERGVAMIDRVLENPGPIIRKAIRIPDASNGMPPNFYLSEKDNIIVCGKIDWLEYDDETDSVLILDFKTGKSVEDEDSLQLPIYYLLTTHCQSREVTGAFYWYLDRDSEPVSAELPDPAVATNQVFNVAKKIKHARQQNVFTCPYGGNCKFCEPFERIVAGDGTYVGVNDINQDMYVINT